MTIRPGFETPTRYVVGDVEYVSDRHVAIRADLTGYTPEQLADMRAATAPPAKLPTRATGPTTQPIGPHIAALLWRASDLTVHDSDVPGKQALCRDGEMVGFATIASYIGGPAAAWTPTVDQLPRIHAVMQCLLDFAYAETGGAEPGVPLCDVADVAYRILDTLAEMESTNA